MTNILTPVVILYITGDKYWVQIPEAKNYSEGFYRAKILFVKDYEISSRKTQHS